MLPYRFDITTYRQGYVALSFRYLVISVGICRVIVSISCDIGGDMSSYQFDILSCRFDILSYRFDTEGYRFDRALYCFDRFLLRFLKYILRKYITFSFLFSYLFYKLLQYDTLTNILTLYKPYAPKRFASKIYFSIQ
jgi:hypothetical protein